MMRTQKQIDRIAFRKAVLSGIVAWGLATILIGLVFIILALAAHRVEAADFELPAAYTRNLEIVDNEGEVKGYVAPSSVQPGTSYLRDREGVTHARLRKEPSSETRGIYGKGYERLGRIVYVESTGEYAVLDSDSVRRYRIRESATKAGQFEVYDNEGKRVSRLRDWKHPKY